MDQTCNTVSKLIRNILKKPVVYNSVYFLTWPYLLLKHTSNQDDPTLYQKSILILKSFGLLLLANFIYLIFGIYKQVVEVILRIKLGNKFLQFVSGTDALMSFYDDSSGLVSAIIQIETSKSADELFEETKQRVLKYFFIKNVNRKFFSTRKFFMGHMYLEDTYNIGIDDVFHKITDVPKDNFDELLYKNSKNPTPLNGLFNWDILFYTHPNKRTKNNKNVFVFQMRMHHLLADGFVLYNVATSLLCDYLDPMDKYSQNLRFKNNEDLQFKTNFVNITAFGLKPNNPIYSGLTNSDSTCCIFGEETGEYYRKIKNIKSKFEGVSFLSVIMAAYSASLSEYMVINRSDKSPLVEKINVITPIPINKKRIEKYYKGKLCEEIKNDFSLCPFFLPVVPKDKIDVPLEDYMVERLMIIQKEFDSIKNSSDSLVIYLLIKTIFNVIPHHFASKMSPPMYTCVVSQIPGGPEMPIFNNDICCQVNYFLPRLPQYGIAFYFITYGNRLNISLTGDKDKFPAREDLFLIIKNTLKYLDILHEQTKNKIK